MLFAPFRRKSEGVATAGRQFCVQKNGMRTIRAVGEVSHSFLVKLLDNPEHLLWGESVHVVKEGRTSRLVRCTLPLNGMAVPVVYKRIRRRNWLKVLTGLFRESRAQRNWRLGHALLDSGISTPRPLVAVVPRFVGFGRDCFIATEWLEEAVSADSYLQQLRALNVIDRGERLKAAARSLGVLLGKMHRHGFRHRDLKAQNVLLRVRSGKTESFVIDLDGAAVAKYTNRSVRVRNLARLVIDLNADPLLSRTNRLVFISAYLREVGDPSWNWRRLWNALERESSLLAIRKQKHRKATTSANSQEFIDPQIEEIAPTPALIRRDAARGL